MKKGIFALLGLGCIVGAAIAVERYRKFLAIIESGEATVIDLRKKEDYDAYHLENAEHLDVANAEWNLDQFDKDKLVVIYGYSFTDNLKVMHDFYRQGFRQVHNAGSIEELLKIKNSKDQKPE